MVGHPSTLHRDLRRPARWNGVATSHARATQSRELPRGHADSSSLLFYEAGLDQRVSGGQGTTQIVSFDFKTGRREVLTSGEGIKLFPQSLEKGRVGYLVRGGPRWEDWEDVRQV